MRHSSSDNAGVYSIRNLVNGKQYIGSSINAPRRMREHEKRLVTGTHKNLKLQRAWNKHGTASFVFEMCESCTSAELEVREQSWIEKCDSVRNGYNLSPTAGRPLGVRWSNRQKQARKQMLASRPDLLAKSRENMEQMRQDPANLAKGLEARNKTYSSPEYRKKRSELATALWSNEHLREKYRLAAKRRWGSMSKEARSEAMSRIRAGRKKRQTNEQS